MTARMKTNDHDAWTGMREDDGRLAPLPPRVTATELVRHMDEAFAAAFARQVPRVLAAAQQDSYDDRQIGAVLKACAVCGQMRYFTRHDATVCGACLT